MGEIKSTLDLVMERTRNLSMTEEEKARQRHADFEKRLQGLLMRYEKGAVPLENLTVGIEALKSELRITDPQPVLTAVFGRIDPEGENSLWLDLIGILKPVVIEPLENILADYRGRRLELKKACELQMKNRFADRYGVKGSAVVPNPVKDREYGKNIEVLKEKARSMIEACC